jgi:hypothetical protein
MSGTPPQPKGLQKKFFKEIAEDLVKEKNIRSIINKINATFDNFRTATTGTADDECDNARKNVMSLIFKYENNTSNTLTNPKVQKKDFPHLIYYNNVNTRKKISLCESKDKKEAKNESELIKYFDTHYMKLSRSVMSKESNKDFIANWKGYCGTCWLCTLPIYFYIGCETPRNPTHMLSSVCGECDHIGGLAASLFAGMFNKSQKDESIYNYGVAHVHCNRVKSSTLTMRFDRMAPHWRSVANHVIDGLVDKILNATQLNSSEPNINLLNEFRAVSGLRQKAINNIRRITRLWCENANRVFERENRIPGAQASVARRRPQPNQQPNQTGIATATEILKIMEYTLSRCRNTLKQKGGESKNESDKYKMDLETENEPELFEENNEVNYKMDLETENEPKLFEENNEVNYKMDLETENEPKLFEENNEVNFIENNSKIKVSDESTSEIDYISYIDDKFGIKSDIKNDEEAQKLLDNIKKTEPELFNELLTNLINNLNKEINDETNDKINYELNKEINNETNDEINYELNKEINNETNDEINYELNKEINNETNDEINRQKLIEKNNNHIYSAGKSKNKRKYNLNKTHKNNKQLNKTHKKNKQMKKTYKKNKQMKKTYKKINKTKI